MYDQLLGEGSILEGSDMQGDKPAVTDKGRLAFFHYHCRIKLVAIIDARILIKFIIHIPIIQHHAGSRVEIDIPKGAVAAIQDLDRDISIHGNGDGFAVCAQEGVAFLGIHCAIIRCYLLPSAVAITAMLQSVIRQSKFHDQLIHAFADEADTAAPGADRPQKQHPCNNISLHANTPILSSHTKGGLRVRVYCSAGLYPGESVC